MWNNYKSRLVALSETRNYKELGSVFLMDRLQNASVLYNFIYENKYPNEEEFNYDSLKTELQKYANQESVYNKMYDINPNDYIEAFKMVKSKRGNNSMEAPARTKLCTRMNQFLHLKKKHGDNSGQVPPNEDSGENIPSTPVHRST